MVDLYFPKNCVTTASFGLTMTYEFHITSHNGPVIKSNAAPGPVNKRPRFTILNTRWSKRPTNPLMAFPFLSLNCGSFDGIADCAGITTAAGCMFSPRSGHYLLIS